jgi:hypothetical protein
MQDQIRDSIYTSEGFSGDSMKLNPQVFIETRSDGSSNFGESFYSKEITRSPFPDWYFILILLILVGIAWLRIVYGKFLNLVFVSAFSFQTAAKTYKEQSVVQRRFGLGLDFLYLISGSLFLFLLNNYLKPGVFQSDGIFIVFQAFTFLFCLILLRIIVMRITAFVFERNELFKGFLYHFFIYNKVIGLILLPFLVAIPYTSGSLQQGLIYSGVSLVIVVYIIRLFRAIVYVIKNVVLFFYLILYLCTLEILPLVVVIKVLLSLAQV